MAFDTKRLKAFKYLEKVATKAPRYLSDCYNPFKSIYMRYGRIYVTNSYLMIGVDFEEFDELANDGWLVVDHYFDHHGYLLEYPALVENDQTIDMDKRDNVFERLFIEPADCGNGNGFIFNARLLEDALYLFKLYDINPQICFDKGNTKMMLTGHNREVSVKAVIMGMRKIK